VAAGGTPAAHLAVWLGPMVGHFVPSLAVGSHSPRPPTGLVQAAEILVELFSHGSVPPGGMATAMAAAIYRVFMDTPPPPKVEAKWPWDWGVVWRRLWGSGLPPAMVDKMFQLLHNVLPLKGRLDSLGIVADGSCPHCGVLETPRHFFQQCPCIADLWEGLYARLVALVPGLPSDVELLMLAFPAAPVAVERMVVAHVAVLVAELWEARSCLRPVSRGDLVVALRVNFPAVRPLFSLLSPSPSPLLSSPFLSPPW
jgi:hypothetical protein